jgi:hypothetical protein
MTQFAIGQQTIATPPNLAYPGDWYGLPGVPGTSTAGYGAIAATDLAIGGFGWVVDAVSATTEVTQAQGSNTRLVFIPRENANTYSNANIAQGWSMTIPTQYQCEVFSNGSFYSFITISYNGGSAINIGDAIFVNTTTGTLAVGVTDQTPFAQTNFVVINNAVANSFGLNMVIISNIQAI